MLSQAKQVVLVAQRREVSVVHSDEKLTAFLVFEELTDQFLRRSTMRCISPEAGKRAFDRNEVPLTA